MMENQSTNTKNILLDTSIILEGMSTIERIPKHHNIFITDIVLRELDGNKKADGVKGYNAREFFRQYNACEFVMQPSMPFSNQTLGRNDKLSMALFSSGMKIYALSRKWYHAKDINDTKIIEIAKDYNLSLMTLDQAQSARAKSEGVEARTPRMVTNNENITIDNETKFIAIFMALLLICVAYLALFPPIGSIFLIFLTGIFIFRSKDRLSKAFGLDEQNLNLRFSNPFEDRRNNILFSHEIDNIYHRF